MAVCYYSESSGFTPAKAALTAAVRRMYVRACMRVLLKPLVTEATFKFWLALNSSQVVVKLRYAPPHPLFTIFSKQVFRQPKQASKSPGGTGCPLSPEPHASISWDSQVCITTACLTSTPCHEASMGPSWWHTRLRHKCPKFEGSLALCQKHTHPTTTNYQQQQY